MLTALMAGAVIPWGDSLIIGGVTYDLQIADLNIAFSMFWGSGIGVYGIMIGGWASNNKFSLLGAIRASAQMISYEIAMGLSIIAPDHDHGYPEPEGTLPRAAGGWTKNGAWNFLVCGVPTGWLSYFHNLRLRGNTTHSRSIYRNVKQSW